MDAKVGVCGSGARVVENLLLGAERDEWREESNVLAFW